MSEIKTLGIDLAKSVFQLHGVDGRGVAVLRKQLTRSKLMRVLAQMPRCVVAMEACASAHYWARRIGALGHTVKLLPPQYVKAYVRGQKTDRNDAAAICAAALDPQLPSVAIKSEQQQAMLAVHRVRQLLDKQRKQLANQLRGLLAEFGHVIPKGLGAVRKALPDLLEQVPPLMRPALSAAQERLRYLQQQLEELTATIEQAAKADQISARLMREPGIGPMTASAFLSTLGDPGRYRNGRQVAASLGIVPRQHSSGGKPVLLGISKRGDCYLRTLLIHGARAVVRHVAGKTDPNSRWLQQLIQRRGVNRATVALANKNARRLWAIWRAQLAAQQS
jgi:transposase